MIAGGFGSAVLEALSEGGVADVSVRRLGVNDVFVEHGSQGIIRKKYGLDAEGIAAAVREMVGDRQKVFAGRV